MYGKSCKINWSLRDILAGACPARWLAGWVTEGFAVQKRGYKQTKKPGMPVPRSVRLLGQLRERIRYLHYSLSSEKTYVHWVRFFLRKGTGRGGACAIVQQGLPRGGSFPHPAGD